MKKIITLDGSESPETLLQKIAESEVFETDYDYSHEEKLRFEKRNRLCYLLNDLEFTIESYGLVNFFVEYSDQITDLEELSVLLLEFEQNETIAAIQKVLGFYSVNQKQFEYLDSDPNDYDEIYNQLESELNSLDGRGKFHIPLNQTINRLTEIISNNPSDFYQLAN